MASPEETQDQVTNGAAAPAPAKRKIANATITGPIVLIQFSELFGSAALEIDTAKVPGPSREMLAAQGAASVIQTAYSAASDPVAAAQAAIDKMLSGEWRPGPPRGEVQTDPLLEAIAAHLSHESKKHVSLEHVEEKFLPAYMSKHALANIASARRRLRAHPDISARVAKIEADRAKAVADRLKGNTAESLLDI